VFSWAGNPGASTHCETTRAAIFLASTL
jgi:hypothetical protein